MQRFVTATLNLETLLRLHAGFFTFPERPITGGHPGASAIAPEQTHRLQRSLSRFTRNLLTRAIAAFVMIWSVTMTYL